MEGFIFLHRRIKEWEWFNNSQMVHIFIYLLATANHKTKTWQGLTIQRGQLITGRLKIHAETGISEQTIRTCLSNLEQSGEITILPTNKFSLITLINFEKYQTVATKSTSQLTNHQPATNQPTNQQLTTTNNVKKDKNVKNEKEVIVKADSLQHILNLKEKGHLPNSIQIVKDYFLENKYTPEAAQQFWNHYEAAGWKTKQKEQITNWKQVANSKWFTEDNKIIVKPKIYY